MFLLRKYVFTLMTIIFFAFAINVQVQAAQCNIVATPLNFGAYDPMSTIPLSATGSLDISCKPNNRVFLVTVQLTSGNSGNFSQRSMLSGGSQLFYNVFANPSHTAVLGDGSAGSVTLSQSVTRQSSWSATFYGQIPALQNVTPGLYSDLLTATILW